MERNWQKDLRYYIDTNLENASVSNGIFMAIVEGETETLLKYEYQNIEDIGQHILG